LLAPNSILNWNQLERKFHEHFFSGENETKLSDLTSVRQGRDEPASIISEGLKTSKTDVLI